MISVIIPTFNKASYLELSLAAWLHQRYSDYELIIVADGCTDRTRAVLDEYSERLPLRAVYIDHRGRAGARNCGLEHARGELIVFCDDDRIAHPDFLNEHMRAQRRSEQPALVIGTQHGVLVQPAAGLPVTIEAAARLHERLQRLGGMHGNAAGTVLTPAHLEAEWSWVEELAIPDPWYENYVTPIMQVYGLDLTRCPIAWSYGTTGNMSIARASVAKVGGFDEGFRGWGLEDTELHYRLARAGVHTRIAPQAVNYHQNHPRDEAAMKWNWLANARHFLAKHEHIDVALYIQAEITNLPLADVCRILEEARTLSESVLLAAYRRLLINHAWQLTTYAKMT